MPYEHRRLDQEGYLLIVGRSPCDLANTLASMRATIEELAALPHLPVLVDIREAGFSPTTAEARQLGELLGDPRLTGARRIAFVVLAGAQFGFARMVSIISGKEGGAVSVFTDIPPAVLWLHGRAASAPT